jgi:hypothetical protein
MERREGELLIGAVLHVGSTRHQIARWDHRRRLFITRNLFTKIEGELPARVLEDGIADGIIIVKERRES